jgi:predicted transcriptional regulator YdeE
MIFTTELDSFYVIGISVRTTNSNGKSLKDIGELFGKFMSQNLIQRIPNKISNDIYCVYTEYESDFNAPYTTIIGCRVSSTEDIPEGFISKIIPTSKYQVYKSIGNLSVTLGKTWEGIWSSEIDRRYSADFDIYGEKAMDFSNGEVDSYVSVN